MPIQGKYFPSQSSNEKVFLLLRRHWFTYAVFIFIACIMAVPFVIFAAIYFTNPTLFEGVFGNFSIIGGTLYFLFILALMLYGFIDYYLDVYIVTNERIVDVDQNGMFKRKISELHLYQVQDVKASVKGAFPTFLHYGNIHVQTAAEKDNFVFNSIPNPYRVSKMIADLHQSQIDDVGKEDSNGVIRRGRKKVKDEEFEKNLTHEDDISLLGKNALINARKNTKKTLDETDSDFGLKAVLEDELAVENADKVMGGVNETIMNDSSNNKNEKKDNKLTDKNKEFKSDGEKKDEPHELHENEEIDI